MSRKLSLPLIFALALLSIAPFLASADGTCTIPDTRLATASDAAVQSGLIKVGDCYNPSDPNIGTTASDAKLWLQQHATKGANISCLNPQFAEKLKTFMEAVPGGPPVITDGYRGQAAQNAAKSSGASQVGWCSGYHNYGLAADFNNASKPTLLWMRQNAPQFGLTRLPAMSVETGCSLIGSGFCDPGHIQITGPLPDSSQCGLCANDSGNGVLPNQSSTRLPFDNSIRQALGVPPPPPPPPPPPMQQPMQPIQPITQPTPTQTQTTSQQTPPSINTLNSTPYPAGTCSPQTYCSQSDGNIYYRATTCVDQKYQTCANGCTGLICNASSTSATNSQLSGLLSPAVTNDNTNSNSNSTATSSFDLISYFANNPITATNIGTATPIDVSQLIQDTGNASVLQAPPSTTSAPIQTPPQGSNAGYGPVPQQTFTSPDLANTPGAYGPQTSTFQIALANMRATLLGILNYLQPFGGHIGAPQGYAE